MLHDPSPIPMDAEELRKFLHKEEKEPECNPSPFCSDIVPNLVNECKDIPNPEQKIKIQIGLNENTLMISFTPPGVVIQLSKSEALFLGQAIIDNAFKL